MVTGESRTVRRGVGDPVVAGTVATDSGLRVQVTATGENTALAGIQRLVTDAQNSSSRAQRLADSAAALLFWFALTAAVITAIVAGTPLAGLVLGVVMLASALASAIGRPIAGRSATKASAQRARFGRALVSSLDSARTIKLAGRTPEVHRHLREVDSGRVDAAVREHRVQAVLDGVPTVMVQVGAVAAWAALLWDVWGLATALLVVNAVNGFDWFGRVAGAVVTEAPGTRSWQKATSRLAGGVDLMDLPEGVDLLTGKAPAVEEPERTALRSLELHHLSAVHDDGIAAVAAWLASLPPATQ